MTITPNAMPKTVNPVRMAVVAGLVAGKDGTRTHKTLVPEVVDGKVKETLVEAQVPAGFGLRFPLARNVSEANVNILAKRWIG